MGAAKTVGQNLKEGAIVVLESTVYPDVTEDVAPPILEQESGMACEKDFIVGYSRSVSIRMMTKIVSGMDGKTADILCQVYGLMTTAYPAPDIRTAEAAKVT